MRVVTFTSGPGANSVKCVATAAVIVGARGRRSRCIAAVYTASCFALRVKGQSDFVAQQSVANDRDSNPRKFTAPATTAKSLSGEQLSDSKPRFRSLSIQPFGKKVYRHLRLTDSFQAKRARARRLRRFYSLFRSEIFGFELHCLEHLVKLHRQQRSRRCKIETSSGVGQFVSSFEVAGSM